MTLPPDIPIPGETWTCPAHPEVRESTPGVCPHCGAALVRDGSPPAPPTPTPSADPAA